MIDEKKSHANYYESGQRAVSLLKEKGCHFLAYFGEGEDSEEMEEYISGFLDAVWEEGISYREECVQGYTNKQFVTLLQTYPYIDGIVTSSDKITFELIRAAKKLNIRIPDKLKIIGLNGSIDSEWAGPSFMQMESCIEENGKIALQQLKGKIKK